MIPAYYVMPDAMYQLEETVGEIERAISELTPATVEEREPLIRNAISALERDVPSVVKVLSQLLNRRVCACKREMKAGAP